MLLGKIVQVVTLLFLSVHLFLWIAFLFLLGCLAAIILSLYSSKLQASNAVRRHLILKALGLSREDKRTLVGFFHPYCNAGGGGELVLWMAIALLQRTDPDVISVVYTGDTGVTKEEIVAKVKSGFDITLDSKSLHFVFLNSRYLVEDATWPRATLLGQSLGSMYLAWEAMAKLIPDIYIDTMGYAFTFHVVRWLGNVPVGAYVHYPTISTSMLARVKSRKRGHTNSDTISSSTIFSNVKLFYYRIFMFYYARSLRKASFLMVNSSWTKKHVDSVLKHEDSILNSVHALFPFSIVSGLIWSVSPPSGTKIVYPPCEVKKMVEFPTENRERIILSVAQFRPEKDHIAQLRSFHELLEQHPKYQFGPAAVKLVLVGGCRNKGDAARVESLRALAKDLDISDNTEFVINASYPAMLKWQSRASIGLSTMVDEHFGVNIVEFMAAGVIPVTHASGGPLNDIVVPLNGQPTGYHATTPATFAEALHKVLTLSKADEVALRRRARAWAVQRFSREEFEKAWEESGWREWLPAAS